MIQKEDINDQYIDTAFWTQVFLGIFLTLISFTAAEWVASFFSQPRLIPILKALSFLFVILAFRETQTALLRRNFAFKALALRSLVGVMASGIVGLSMALSGYGVWSLVGGQLTYEIVGVILLWKVSTWRPKLQFSWQSWLELLSFSGSILGFKLMVFFNKRTDNLLIGYFLGEIALGYYAIAHRILEIMLQLLTQSVTQVAVPTFSRLQSDPKRLLKAFYRATHLTSLIAFPVFFATIILTPEIIKTLIGEKWEKSIPILQIICFSGIIKSIAPFQGASFLAMGQPFIRFKLSLVNAIINLIACLIAVRWGMLVVAGAYVISDYLVFPIGQWLLSKLLPLSWRSYLALFAAPIVCSSAMAVMMLFTQRALFSFHSPPVNLIVSSLMGTIGYGTTLKIVFPQVFSQLSTTILSLRTSRKTADK